MTSNDVTGLSQKLLQYIERIEILFQETQVKKEAPDFFLEVKPFADEVYDTLIKWEKDTVEWIKEESPKYIHTQQIDSTVENVKHVSVQCFYPDTREIKFKGMLQSIRYVLQDILTKKL
ncbi:YppE family protein [Sutcliffiella halmapala]|uniref:YppE family protein n=1 Tax=Sutcliffiella halmapala TaxID=79882 RepID=UPI000994E46F|nr:YppE family protein [Sutcliffiella halmapala]